jgi:hypothetical protein
MSVLAVPGSMDMMHTLSLSAARAEVKVVTYALEAEYTVMRGTVSIADRLLTLMMQQPPRLHIDGMIKRVISCIAEMLTCIYMSAKNEKRQFWRSEQ